MKKGDWAVFAAIVLLALLPLLLVNHTQKAMWAQVRVDGVAMQRLPLASNGDHPIVTPLGTNLVCVRDGAVCIREADCPGLACVQQGWISRAGQVLVCLPHKLTVVLEGEEGSGYDAVTQ